MAILGHYHLLSEKKPIVLTSKGTQNVKKVLSVSCQYSNVKSTMIMRILMKCSLIILCSHQQQSYRFLPPHCLGIYIWPDSLSRVRCGINSRPFCWFCNTSLMQSSVVFDVNVRRKKGKREWERERGCRKRRK